MRTGAVAVWAESDLHAVAVSVRVEWRREEALLPAGARRLRVESSRYYDYNYSTITYELIRSESIPFEAADPFAPHVNISIWFGLTNYVIIHLCECCNFVAPVNMILEGFVLSNIRTLRLSYERLPGFQVHLKECGCGRGRARVSRPGAGHRRSGLSSVAVRSALTERVAVPVRAIRVSSKFPTNYCIHAYTVCVRVQAVR